jgi:hypothetical protein
MKNIIKIAFVLALLFGAKAFGQEWEYIVEHTDNDSPWLKDPIPLQGGNIAVPYTTFYSGSTSQLGSKQPGMLILSSDGEELTRKSYLKPAFWGHSPYLLSDDEGAMYMLVDYNPDHDTTIANYFMNFDNPPDYSILGLYELDENFSIVESYEHQIPIDTFSCPETDNSFGSHNEYCGSIYVFSAIVDDNTIVGGYMKTPTSDYFNPRGHDSVFFFRMGFDGTLIHRKGYDLDYGIYGWGGNFNWSNSLMGHDIMKTDEGIVFFYDEQYPIAFDAANGKEKMQNPGHAFFLDYDFNLIEEKRYEQRPGLPHNYFQYSTYVPSRHNSVYLSCSYHKNATGGKTGCALYEYGLNADRVNTLPTLRYIERTSSGWDFTAQRKGTCVDADNTIYFAYSLNDGLAGMTIEHLDPDFDIIRTLYYDLRPYFQPCEHIVQTVEVDENGDLLLTFNSYNADNLAQQWSTITKFPAEAFVGIDEAHNNGLKVAIAYPNPGKDVLNIRTGLKDARLEVYDMSGRMVYRQEIMENLTSINTEGWPAGAYVWKVYTSYGGPSTGSGTLAEMGKWIKE